MSLSKYYTSSENSIQENLCGSADILNVTDVIFEWTPTQQDSVILVLNLMCYDLAWFSPASQYDFSSYVHVPIYLEFAFEIEIVLADHKLCTTSSKQRPL